MIRIAQPIIGPDEEAAVLRALRSGQLAQGKFVAEFEQAIADELGVRHAVAVSSGTAVQATGRAFARIRGRTLSRANGTIAKR